MNRQCGFRSVPKLVLTLVLCTILLTTSTIHGATRTKPRLNRVILYRWGLVTSITSVDLRAGTMRAFGYGVRVSKDGMEYLDSLPQPQHRFARIKSPVRSRELAQLADLVSKSGLRSFQPTNRDLRLRKPYVDECPPTLVLVWSDKTRVFGFPLEGTVRKDIAATRRRAYQGMSDTRERISKLEETYGKQPYLSWSSSEDPEYTKLKLERDRGR